MADQYQRGPIPWKGVAPFAVAYTQIEANGAGATTAKLWWNHAAQGFEAGDRDEAKHLRRLERLSTDPQSPDYVTQYLWADGVALSRPNVIVTVYAVDETGKPTEVHETGSRLWAGMSSGVL